MVTTSLYDSVVWIFCFTQVLCLLPMKPQSDFAVAWCVIQRLTLCLQLNQFCFSTTYIDCFPGHIFTNMGQLTRLLFCKLLQMCKGINVLLVYKHILVTWELLIPSIPKVRRPSTSPTNYHKCCKRQPKCHKLNHKYFTFTHVKSHAAYIQVVIISKFLT
jgi:hypothetical protein